MPGGGGSKLISTCILKPGFSKYTNEAVFSKSILQQNVTFWFQNFWVSKLLDLVSKKFGIKKVSDLVLFNFWVSSHTVSQILQNIFLIYCHSYFCLFETCFF